MKTEEETAHERLGAKLDILSEIRRLAELVLTSKHRTTQDGGHQFDDKGELLYCERCDLERELGVELVRFRVRCD